MLANSTADCCAGIGEWTEKSDMRRIGHHQEGK